MFAFTASPFFSDENAFFYADWIPRGSRLDLTWAPPGEGEQNRCDWMAMSPGRLNFAIRACATAVNTTALQWRLCCRESQAHTRNVWPMLIWCWATVADGGTTSNLHWRRILSEIGSTIGQDSVLNLNLVSCQRQILWMCNSKQSDQIRFGRNLHRQQPTVKCTWTQPDKSDTFDY